MTGIPPEEADGQFTWLPRFVAIDNPTSSTLTQKELGGHPTHPGLIADLEEGHYFND